MGVIRTSMLSCVGRVTCTCTCTCTCVSLLVTLLVSSDPVSCVPVCMSVYPSICLPVRLVCLSIRPSFPSVCPSIHLSVCPSVCLSVRPSVHLSVHPYVHLSVSTVRLSFRPPLCPSIHLSVCLSVRLSIRPSVHLSACPISPSVSQSYRLCVCNRTLLNLSLSLSLCHVLQIPSWTRGGCWMRS